MKTSGVKYLVKPKPREIIQQGDSTPNLDMGSYLAQNHNKFSQQGERGEQKTKETRNEIPESLSEGSKINFKSLSNTQQCSIPLKQDKAQNRLNFITLRTISEKDKIQIIQTGFQLQSEGKISLKKYYEGRETHSLDQLKGYSIKYETIRRTKLYKSLKES
jgi:hypothetical protein